MFEEDLLMKSSNSFVREDLDNKKYSNLSLLRKYFYLCFVIWILLFFSVFFYHHIFLDFLVNYFSSNFDEVQLVSLEVTKPFSLLLSASLYFSFILVLPLILFYFWRFISPGLYPHEIKVFKNHLVLSLLSVTLFQFFSFYFVAPTALKFFLNFNQAYLGNMVDIFSLAYFVFSIQKGFFICSLLPVFLSILLRFRVLSLYVVEQSRRWFYIGAFILAMLLTPPDVISQCLMAIPLIFLFEGTILFLKHTL